MAIDQFLLDILVCPEDKSPVTLIDSSTLAGINARIRSGGVLNRGGKAVNQPIDGGLLRADKKFLYPIRKDIPIMLIEEGIPANDLGITG